MKIKTSLFLAYKTLKRGNKWSLAMTLFMMILIFINLIFISAVFEGIIQGVNQEAINNQYGNILIEPEVGEKYIKNKNAIKNLENLPRVTGFSTRYINNSEITYDRDSDGRNIENGRWLVESIIIEEEKGVTNIYQTMIDGEYLSHEDRDKVILGREIAGGEESNSNNNLGGVKVGEKVNIKFSNGIKKTYEIKGIFNSKNSQANNTAFITKKEMESVMGIQGFGFASKILVKTDPKVNENEYISVLRNIGFREEKISTWNELMGMTKDVNRSFAMVSAILGVIGTFVAGITIFIIIFVGVVNKRKEIGILKAIGMRESTIVLSFVIQALFYATVGVILGTALTLFLITPYFESHPMDFPMGWVSLKITPQILIYSGVSLILATIVGSFVPSYKAARESILNAIFG